MGAEKFFDIKCRYAGLKPDAVVLVATVRALKMHGGVPKTELATPNVEAVKRGIVNLEKHIENIKQYGLPLVVAINAFAQDTPEELEAIRTHCAAHGVNVALSEVFAKGGEGGVELAKEVVALANSGKADFKLLYGDELSLKEKIETIAKRIYGAVGVNYTKEANNALKDFEKWVTAICRCAWLKPSIPSRMTRLFWDARKALKLLLKTAALQQAQAL